MFHTTKMIIPCLFSKSQDRFNDNKSTSISIETISNVDFMGDEKKFVLLSDNKIQIYTISDKKGENIINGYGLSYRKGKFIITDTKNKSSVFDVIKSIVTNENYDSKMTCDSGGEGSMGCSIESPIIGGSCSVSCGTGYYSCCNQSSNECKCIRASLSSEMQNKRIGLTENPSYGILKFEFIEKDNIEKITDYQINIYNHIGHLVYTGKLLNEIDFTKNRSGVYFYVITKDKNYTQKDKFVLK